MLIMAGADPLEAPNAWLTCHRLFVVVVPTSGSNRLLFFFLLPATLTNYALENILFAGIFRIAHLLFCVFFLRAGPRGKYANKYK